MFSITPDKVEVTIEEYPFIKHVLQVSSCKYISVKVDIRLTLKYDFLFKYNNDPRILELSYKKDHHNKYATFLVFCEDDSTLLDVEKEINIKLNLIKNDIKG